MLTAIAFLAAFSVGCLLAIFRHPVYGLATYVALVYAHPPTSWWGAVLPSLRWSLIAAGVTLFAVLIRPSRFTKPGLLEFGFIRGLILFVVWLGIQMIWALDRQMQTELLVIFAKYALLTALVYKCIDSIAHLKVFLWTHAAGCFYLGTVVLADYLGGRFEGFRGPGISESNAAALLIVTGVITTFALFLSGKLIEKIVAVGFMPLTLNALVATISRSGFLALGVAGVLFNLFAPKKIAGVVRVLSLVGLVLFLAITNPVYWDRIDTITIAGEEVEGVDTGGVRLELLKAQFEMFEDYPMGCGHRCTAVLSPAYLESRYLTGREGESRARSSHNTFMSLLVEQGIPGALFYILSLIWIARLTFRLRSRMRCSSGMLPIVYAAVVASLGAITVGDLFVDYLKFEARFWFIGLLMVLVKMDANQEQIESQQLEQAAGQPVKAK